VDRWGSPTDGKHTLSSTPKADLVAAGHENGTEAGLRTSARLQRLGGSKRAPGVFPASPC